MSLLNKFKAAGQKAEVQAAAFMNKNGTQIAFQSKDSAQNLSLEGESKKVAAILESFLGALDCFYLLFLVN